MERSAFEALKSKFSEADTDEKIAIYVDTDELTQPQYKELLQMFPLSALDRLEAALA